ncbi:hypothetical protein QFZ76_009508 [Streptomyces sp. V4I2]|nr:hypothetical protein [Streptomyces sp. V4I2]
MDGTLVPTRDHSIAEQSNSSQRPISTGRAPVEHGFAHLKN